MLVRAALAALAALGLSIVAVGCGSNDRPFTFGGNPNTSPDNAAPSSSVTRVSR